MNTKSSILLCAAFLQQVFGQVVLDTYDPTKTRAGAAIPASVDPYGWNRPLTPSIDPFGVSYRPAVAGAVYPAVYDPFVASRPIGTAIPGDGYGAYGRFGEYGSYGIPRPISYQSYPTYIPLVMDNWTGYRPTVATNIVPVVPDNSASTLVSTTPLNYASPVQSPVNTLPVAVPVPVPVNTMNVPTVNPVNTVPVNTAPATMPTFNPMSFPNGMGLSAFNGGGLSGTGTGMPNFMGMNTGGSQMPGMVGNPGNLQIPGMGLPMGTGTSTNTGNANASPLLPPLPS